MKKNKSKKTVKEKKRNPAQSFGKSSKDLEKESGLKSEFGSKKNAPPEEPKT